ncbi:hypothetical protein M378DRAFT_40352, partial [Amanita muscaria Koide BX008]
KKTVIVSIMMQSSSQKANTFQSVLGFFLHSCRAPEKVIETLAHIGISISMSAIHSMVRSLSINSRQKMVELGRTMCAAYAYDNFDVNLKPNIPLIEKTTENLKHLTSGLIFP